MDSGWRPQGTEPEPKEAAPQRRPVSTYAGTAAQDKELQAIFERTYGAVKRESFLPPKAPKRPAADNSEEKRRELKQAFSGEDYLLVDGYNIIFAWDELKKLAAENLDAARKKLCDLLCNYQGYRKCRVILVFDAYKVKGGLGSVEKYHNIYIVYTKEAETADAYIERATYEIGRQHRVRVATSDGAGAAHHSGPRGSAGVGLRLPRRGDGGAEADRGRRVAEQPEERQDRRGAGRAGTGEGGWIMLTLLIAAAVLAACTALRWFLDRPERKDEAFWNGRIRLTALWNEGAAFSLPMKRKLVAALSILILPLVWVFRRRNPIGAGLALGGGLSNLWERLRHGRVYDYVQFPKLPKLGRYVWNLADLAILIGGLLLALLERKK